MLLSQVRISFYKGSKVGFFFFFSVSLCLSMLIDFGYQHSRMYSGEVSGVDPIPQFIF